MNVFDPKIYLKKLEKRCGYYELTVDSLTELFELIRPDKVERLESVFEQNNFSTLGLGVNTPVNFINYMFRGVSDSNFELTPTFYRGSGLKSFNQPWKNYSELNLLRNFIKACDLSATQIPNDSLKLRNLIKDTANFHDAFTKNRSEWLIDDYYELIAFAQHYGVPTRLLDWSYQSLVSLYFASMGALKSIYESKKLDMLLEKSFSLWVYSPISHVDDDMQNFLDEEIKIIEVPKSINQHISFQQGCFITITQRKDKVKIKDDSSDNIILNIKKDNDYKHLNDKLKEYNLDCNLMKINISYVFALDVYDLCNAFNFNSATLFRGPHGGSKHVQETMIVETVRNASLNKKFPEGA